MNDRLYLGRIGTISYVWGLGVRVIGERPTIAPLVVRDKINSFAKLISSALTANINKSPFTTSNMFSLQT